MRPKDREFVVNVAGEVRAEVYVKAKTEREAIEKIKNGDGEWSNETWLSMDIGSPQEI